MLLPAYHQGLNRKRETNIKQMVDNIKLLHSGRAAAWLATILLWIPSGLSVLLYFDWTNHKYPVYNSDIYGSYLDSRYLAQVWAWRRANFGFILSLDFFGALGLLISIYCIFCIKSIYKWSARFLSNIMLYTYLIGALLPSLEFLQNMGAYTAAYDLYQQITNMNDFVSLEISYQISQASSVWVFSLIYVLLGISVLCASALFWFDAEYRSKAHAILGVVVASVGFIAFIIEVSLFFNRTSQSLRYGFGVMTLFWGVICMPLWLIMLGHRINRVYETTGGDARHDDLDSSQDIELQPTDVVVETDRAL